MRLQCPMCKHVMSLKSWKKRTVNGITYHCPKCNNKLHKEELRKA